MPFPEENKMKMFTKFHSLKVARLMVFILLSFGTACNAGLSRTPSTVDSGAQFPQDISPPAELITYHNYSGFSELVTMVCDDAIQEFIAFYGPQDIMVQPFVYISQAGTKRMTMLGVTLADQMVAMVNNTPANMNIKGDAPQKLGGVLQEVDGLLRVHISGMNSWGNRRSFSVNVEMSEALYRALHTQVGG